MKGGTVHVPGCVLRESSLLGTDTRDALKNERTRWEQESPPIVSLGRGSGRGANAGDSEVRV
jgi:hypothetical protein